MKTVTVTTYRPDGTAFLWFRFPRSGEAPESPADGDDGEYAKKIIRWMKKEADEQGVELKNAEVREDEMEPEEHYTTTEIVGDRIGGWLPVAESYRS